MKALQNNFIMKKKLVFNNKPNPSRIIDGKKIWFGRSPSVICAIIVRECPVPGHSIDYILISRRGKGSPDHIGKWNLVCGYLDWHENATNGCYREVWEETGLDLKELIETEYVLSNHMDQPFYVNTDPSENNENVGLRHGVHIRVESIEDFIKKNPLTWENSEPNEVDGYAWITLDEVEDYEFAFNHDDVIRYYVDMVN